MIAYQKSLSSYVSFLFRWAYYNYVICQIVLEKLTFSDPYCSACPRPGEPGPVYVAADGNFSLYRFKKADSDVQKRDSELKGLFFLSQDGSDLQDIMDEEQDLCSNFTAVGLSTRNQNQVKDETGMYICLKFSKLRNLWYLLCSP